jgi:hypothetical protein
MVLVILEPLVTFVLAALALLGLLTSLFFYLVGPPEFPLWTMLALSLGFAIALLPYYAAKPQPIKVLIRPECKAMFYGPDFVDLDVHGKPKPTKKRPKPDYVEWDPSLAKPLSFKDPHTSTFFYVESDGRHLAAISSEGGLLWVRNPFEDRHLCPYRTPRPTSIGIEAAVSDNHAAAIRNWGGDLSHDLLFVQFSGSQFGVID